MQGIFLVRVQNYAGPQERAIEVRNRQDVIDAVMTFYSDELLEWKSVEAYILFYDLKLTEARTAEGLIWYKQPEVKP